jgi:hypothetical protein
VRLVVVPQRGDQGEDSEKEEEIQNEEMEKD